MRRDSKKKKKVIKYLLMFYYPLFIHNYEWNCFIEDQLAVLTYARDSYREQSELSLIKNKVRPKYKENILRGYSARLM